MIAKSISGAILLVLLFSIPARAEIKNLYERILTEYAIHPPELEYGYPLWYQYDSLPITGIIFLKNGLDDLYREDKITYVAEPTKENAEIILNFSGKVGAYPKFYIVPDSNLTWREVYEFTEVLKTSNPRTQLALCGGEGIYMNFYRKSEGTNCFRMGCCIRTALIILQNCRDEVLLEGELRKPDEIAEQVYQFYLDNQNGQINNDDGIHWQLISSEDLTDRIRRYEESLQNPQDLYCPEDTFDLKVELVRLRSLRNLYNQYGVFSIPDPTAFIQVKSQFCGRSVGSFYAFADLINKGVYQSRQEIATGSGVTYNELFAAKRLTDLSWVHTQIPDICRFYFEDDWPTRPPIEMYPVEVVKIQPDTLKR